MSKKDFQIVNDNGRVSIVRTSSSASNKHALTGQKMRVMCFDSAQIDRIFSIQEHSVRSVSKK